MAKDIVLYAAELCGDCQLLKRFLDEQGIAYTLRDIRANPEHARELESQTGKLGVPYLVIDGRWVRGYHPGQPFSHDFAHELLGSA
jgi:glutaredoxin